MKMHSGIKILDRWLENQTYFSEIVRHVYFSRYELSLKPSNEALEDYRDFLTNFAKRLYPDIKIEVYFLPFLHDNRGPQIVHVGINRRVIAFGISNSFFVNDVPRSAFSNRLMVILLLFGRAAQLSGVSFKNFTVNLADEHYESDIGFSARCEGTLLIPDPDFLISGGYFGFKKKIAQFERSWNDRHPVFTWRGSTTGKRRNIDIENHNFWFKVLPRTEFCSLLRHEAFRQYCDVGISSIVQIEEESLKLKVATYLQSNFISKEDQGNSRYLFDIDGNANAWSNLMMSFLTGSCVIKVASEQGYRQWYYPRLLSGRDFIPVVADFSNLEEAIHWALANCNETRQIAEEGARLAYEMDLDREIDNASLEILNI